MKKDQTKIVITVTIILIIITFFIISLSKSTKVTNSISYQIATATPISESTSTPTQVTPLLAQSKYIEVINACDWTGVGTCVNMRSGAGTEYPIVNRLRNGVVLKTSGGIVVDGMTWYKILFSEELHFPERVKSDLYVAGTEYVKFFTEDIDEYTNKVSTSTTKYIVVDLSKEILYAYDGDVLYMDEPISTGLNSTPTPRGTFFIYKKTPSRYMQGPIKGFSDQYFDLPGVPWDLYFTKGGDVIHGAYWHNKFGQPWSHGCVNLRVEQAKRLYEWADIGTPVTVQY